MDLSEVFKRPPPLHWSVIPTAQSSVGRGVVEHLFSAMLVRYRTAQPRHALAWVRAKRSPREDARKGPVEGHAAAGGR
jgi:hypothetical protein